MSVLLEALKKAAEEKQRKLSGDEASLLASNEPASIQTEETTPENASEFNKPTDNETLKEDSTFKIVEEDVPSLALSKKKPLDLETSLALEDSPLSNRTVLDEKIEVEEPVRPLVDPVKQDEEGLNSTYSASFAHQAVEKDWSLNQIPGYQDRESDVQSGSKPAQSILQAMQFKQERAPDYSKLVLSGLVSMTLLLGLSYYGVVYFQKQSEKMTTELQSYQSVEAPLKGQTSEVGDQNPPEVSDNHLAVESKSVHGQAAKGEKPVEQTERSRSTEDVSSTKPLVKKSTVVSDEKPRKKAEPSQVLKAIPEPSKQLKIVSSTLVSDEMLGYEAYQKNDFQQAEQHYLAALKKNPKNLTALFGMGATAAKQGEVHAALNFYRQALDVSPYNKEAETAVAILEATLTQSEPASKRLKFMINQSPNNAKLHAALGHQYAKQKNWIKAQKQYFKAYQLNPDNADYALNLAISLDQIGQYSLAKQYYQRVLVHSHKKRTEVSVRQIKNRLLTLQQYLEQGGDQ